MSGLFLLDLYENNTSNESNSISKNDNSHNYDNNNGDGDCVGGHNSWFMVEFVDMTLFHFLFETVFWKGSKSIFNKTDANTRSQFFTEQCYKTSFTEMSALVSYTESTTWFLPIFFKTRIQFKNMKCFALRYEFLYWWFSRVKIGWFPASFDLLASFSIQ